MTSTTLNAAMLRLRVDRVSAEVVAALTTAHIDPILLKGPSIARWLYKDDGSRHYVDTDLLVAPSDFARAEAVLGELGFARIMSDEQLGETIPSHTWARAADRVMVDLHRTVPGATADPQAVWDLLSRRTTVLTIGNVVCRTPDADGTAAHVALHAASHGPAVEKPLMDLRRALTVLSLPDWERAADVANGMGATAAFGTGLRLGPRGEGVATQLGLPTEVPVEVRLKAVAAPPTALGMARLARTQGLAAKVALLLRKAAPPPSFVRYWSPIARHGRLGLAAAYVIRPFWLLAHLPAGVRAWRRAVRRET